jgi:hypothetical protein
LEAQRSDQLNHSFEIDDAIQHGINAAIILSHLRFWIAKNEANDKHLYEGIYWTYSSINAFAKLFPYLSAKQIRTSLDGLESSGVIRKGNFNQSAYDRTTWYAITVHQHLPVEANENAQQGKCLIDTDKEQIEGDILFANFWSSYPRKEGKVTAKKSFTKCVKSQECLSAILSDVKSRLESKSWKTDPAGISYIPMPASYLNQRRWEDERSEPATSFEVYI